MKNKRLVFFLSFFGVLFNLINAADFYDEDLPFGKMREKDRERFIDMAKSHGVAIYEEMEKAYGGDKEAFSRVLGLSSQFNSMDSITKIYGNLIFASFINLVEERGEQFFSDAILSLPNSDQQKVRDFVYFAVIKVPKKHRKEVEKEVRRDFPLFFPKGYIFGKGNPIFE